MNEPTKPKRRWYQFSLRTLFLFMLIVAVGVCAFVPLPVRPVDKDRAIDKSIDALLNKKRVFLDWKYRPFYDSRHFDFDSMNVYYENDAEISDSVFEKHNIVAVSDSSQVTLGPDGVIQVTYYDYHDNEMTEDLHFLFFSGPTGGIVTESLSTVPSGATTSSIDAFGLLSLEATTA